MNIKRHFNGFLSEIRRPPNFDTSRNVNNEIPPPLALSTPTGQSSGSEESTISAVSESTSINSVPGYATVINIDSSSNSSAATSTMTDDAPPTGVDKQQRPTRESHTKRMHIHETTPSHTPTSGTSSNRDSFIPSPPRVTDEIERAAERNAARTAQAPFANNEDYDAFFKYRERVPSAIPTIYGDRNGKLITAATWSGHKVRRCLHSPLESIFSDSSDNHNGLLDYQLNGVKRNTRSTPGGSKKAGTVHGRSSRIPVPSHDYVPWKSLEGLADISALGPFGGPKYSNKSSVKTNKNNSNAMHHRSLPKLSGLENCYDPGLPPATFAPPPLRQALSWSNLIEQQTKGCEHAYQPQLMPAYINRPAAAWRHAHDNPWAHPYIMASQNDLFALSYGCDVTYRSMHDFGASGAKQTYGLRKGVPSVPPQAYGNPQEAQGGILAPPPYWSNPNAMPPQQGIDNDQIINMGPMPVGCPETSCSSEVVEKGDNSRGCMVGWMLACTAIIILALAIGLFVQVSKDAQQMNRLRSTVSNQWEEYSKSLEEHT